jgi:hypothetical protein
VVTRGARARRILIAIWLVTCAASPSLAQNELVLYDDELKIVHFEDFEYPVSVREAGVEGTVVVRGTIGSNGYVTDVAAISGPRALVADTLANARTWRYELNRQKRVVIIYRFQLVDRCAPGTASSLFKWYGPNTAVITGCRKESNK